jgi:DNA-binding winged helix-turn-helix (wHTH) protein
MRTAVNQHDIQLPLSFRSNLLQDLMPALRAGECCSLIGISGVGKTNLVRYIQRPDVQAAYWGGDTVWVVLIDTNSLAFSTKTPEFIVLELMIHRLIREAERHGLPSELVADFDRLHSTLVAQPDAYLALRYLDRICGRLCEDQQIQIIFAFDQFEDIWTGLDPRLFLNLRYLRDEYKYRLAYLVITRERLQRSRKEQQMVEAFWELFSTHVFGLGMYDESDATFMLERIAGRQGVILSDELRHAAISISGGHPALLRAVFWELYNKPLDMIEPAALLAVHTIFEECSKIWNDLFPTEQQILRAIVFKQLPPTDSEALGELFLKEIIAEDRSTLFSPIFHGFIMKEQIGENTTGIVVDVALRQVLRDGAVLAGTLPPLEFSLIEHLARNAGKVCRREDILKALYGDEVLEVNDERLDTLLRRLREALGDDARQPHYLFTHRGVGIRLAQGRVQE